MANYLEYSSDQERYEKERLAYRVYAAKVFRFIFKNVFDKLLFVRTLSIKGVRFDLFIDDDDGKKRTAMRKRRQHLIILPIYGIF